jgi:hypothetical protein
LAAAVYALEFPAMAEAGGGQHGTMALEGMGRAWAWRSPCPCYGEPSTILLPPRGAIEVVARKDIPREADKPASSDESYC